MRNKPSLTPDFLTEEDSFNLAQHIALAASDAKGQDILVLDVKDLFSLADYFVIVSARSDRQAQGISNKILERLVRQGVKPLAISGLEEGQWILIDCDDVIVHVFYEPQRLHYDLEGLWYKANKYIFNEARGTLAKKRPSA